MFPYNASRHSFANDSEVQPSTPKKSKPKNNKPVTPRKGCENLKLGVIQPHYPLLNGDFYFYDIIQFVLSKKVYTD